MWPPTNWSEKWSGWCVKQVERGPNNIN
jgi:hypothetical protein